MTTYDDWKADRQKYLDSRSPMQRIRDAQYQQWNKNDAYYDTLGDRIQFRQDNKIPIAGEGAVQFLSTAGTITRFVAIRTGFFPLALLAKGIGAAETFVRQQAEL